MERRHDRDALLVFGPGSPLEHLAVMLAWGSVAGSILQFAVQAPIAFRLTTGGGPFALSEPVRRAIRDFFPVLISRGAVQISAFIDQFIASFLPTGAVTGLSNTALIYTLPVSLFGISVSAAQLPALSRDAALADTAQLRDRIDGGLARLAFFVVPSAVAFAALGDIIAGVLLQHGHFRAEDSRIVWGMLAGSAVGLVASTQSRLYCVAHYALGDTKTPLRFALIRIAFVTGLGWICALVIPPWLGVRAMWGAAGLTASAGVSGWIEFALLRHSLNRRVGRTGLPVARMLTLWAAALAGAAVAWGVRLSIPWSNPMIRGGLILPAFGLTYLACAALAGIDVRHQLMRE